MTKGQRIVLFLLSLASLLLILFLTDAGQLVSAEHGVVLVSALVMLSFVALFIEHFFTTPTDVLASTLAILLVLSPLHSQLSEFGHWYWIFFSYNAVLLLLSLVSLMLLDGNKGEGALQNRASSHLKRVAVFFGNGRFLFGMLFFLTLCFYVDSQSTSFLVLSAYAAVLLAIDPKRFTLSAWQRRKTRHLDVGEIIGVQSRNTVLARLYAERPAVRRFDLASFRYATDERRQVCGGMVIDTFLLNEQQWVKILVVDELSEAIASSGAGEMANVVYKMDLRQEPEILQRFVGVVVERSSIMKIRFDYAARVEVLEGCLLELEVSGRKVLYQVTQGLTEVELLEQKNEAGLVVGEAVQLGVWDPMRLVFEKFGWVPEINTPLFLAVDAPPFEPGNDEEQVGTIPGTNYPVLLNRQQAVTYHMAILGVTGSGKSVFCRDLIRRIVADGTKVICVDFTNEYRSRFPDLGPQDVVDAAQKQQLFEAIDGLSTELDKFRNQQNPAVIATHTQSLRDGFYESIKSFVESDRPLALFELPDVSNTTGILEYTKWFFRELFEIARKDANFGKRICVVLEEAHTVIPEWNFIGVEERKAQSLVNSISQIALQGRKHGVGFVVVAQRTANVSKTVLTQCNTIVAFQQFDRTSSDFLLNYMGAEMAAALPTLRFRQAIAVGKAFRSGVPVIFEVPEIVEPEA